MEKPDNYLTAEEARQSVKQFSAEAIFQTITERSWSGGCNYYLPLRVVNKNTRDLLREAGYTVRVSGTDNEVLIIEW